MDTKNASKVVSKKKYFLERIGCLKNKTIPLPIGVYNVGRSKSAHVIIPSKYCNRKHCRLIVDCESCSVCVDGEKSVGGVYVNEQRYRSGKIVLQENDLIGFGNPTNLSEPVIASYRDQVHIYKVRCSTVANAKWIPSTVLPMLKNPPARPPTPPRPSTPHDKDEPADADMNTNMAGANSATNEKRCRFSSVVNFRLYDPEDYSNEFIED